MNRNAPLYWHQGLLLQPQHFQLESQYHQAHVTRITQLLGNDSWGVNSLTIHEDALAEKRLVVSEGELLFPDGSLCSIPESASVSSRQFDHAWVETGQPFTVYLGLRQWQTQGSNVAEVEAGASGAELDSRLITDLDPHTVPDLYGQGAPGQARQMRYLVKIFWESEVEQAGDYQLIPIARLERDGPNIRLCERFVPPLLNVQQWPGLRFLLTDLRDQMVSRARQVERFKQPGERMLEEGQFDVGLMLAIQALNRCAWRVQDLVETPVVHPRLMWSSLCSMVAELSSFVMDLSVAGEPGTDRWPEYDHCRLAQVFDQLQYQLKRALRGIIVGPEYVVRLEKQQGIWSCELEERALSGEFRYWLLFRGCEREKLLGDLGRMVKLASTEGLTALMARAVSGIPLTPQESTPHGLPYVEAGLYCEIDKESPLWQQVCDSRRLGLYWMSPEEGQVTLYITRG
ncbi:type VI secretion system baseplate subunit TssK [Dongshaea marina]|uniref:type VI secretion system baseplate subunit TssK n=1 Tax=Dongshaea marina TaxID=2047966 RepID=UPI000D3EA1DA|nr:type VI secretion system baseplate subunit TssK [Dongshaea marina]